MQSREANYGKLGSPLIGLLTVGGEAPVLIGYARVSTRI